MTAGTCGYVANRAACIHRQHGLGTLMRYLLLLALLLGALNSTASDLDNVVKIDSGYVAGSGTTIRSYKGIPFAAPPVGDLRWRAPQPVKPWTTIRTAKTFSLSCPQTAVAKEKMSEDC